MKQSLISEEYIPNTVSTPLDNGVWGTTQHDGRTQVPQCSLTHTLLHREWLTLADQHLKLRLQVFQWWQLKVRPGILLEVESQWQPKLLMVYTAV